MDVNRLFLLLAGVLFATGGAALKLAPGLAPIDVAGLRSGIAALVILLVVRESRGRPDLRTCFIAMSYAATLVLFALANRLTTSANAVFLQSTAPLWVMILGPFLLAERPKRRDLFVLALLAIGASLCFFAKDEATAIAPDPALGNLLATASGVTWAITVLGLRALGRSGGNGAERAAALGNGMAFAISIPFLSLDRIAAASTADWLALSYLGVVQIGLAYVLLTRAVRHVPAVEASLILMIEPALNPFFALLVHGERPAALAAAGGAVVIGAIALKTLLDVRTRSQALRGAPT